jgi:hypothetical protein
MEVKDLVAGKHIVQLRNGEIGLVWSCGRNELTIVNERTNLCTPSFYNDFPLVQFEIVKVGIPTFRAGVGIFEKPNWIWEEKNNEEPVKKEMTIAEIEEELGYSIKVVK